MKRITLRTCPCRTSPDNALVVGTVNSLVCRLVIANRIEVMLIETCTAVAVDTIIQRCALAKVNLDDRNALLYQALKLLGVPFTGLRISEIENGILERQLPIRALHRHSILYKFVEIAVLRSEVRQLPQAGVETVSLEVFQHLNRVLEVLLRELIVALPVNLKPSCIEMDNIRRNLVITQLLRNATTFCLGEIRDTRHPCAERPERWKCRLSYKVGIFIQNLLWRAEHDEEVGILIAHEELSRTDI